MSARTYVRILRIWVRSPRALRDLFQSWGLRTYTEYDKEH